MYRKTILLAALLLVLSLVFVFQESWEIRRNTLEVVAPAEGVETVTIRRGEERLLLAREGSGWRVGAERYPGDTGVIEELLSTVREVGEVEVISGRSNYGQYGLTGPDAYELSLAQDGTEVLTLRLGANAAAGSAVYGRVNDRPEVVLLPRRIKERASVESTEFREKVMASIAEERIGGATVSGTGAGTFILTAIENPELPEEASQLEAIDASWQIEGPEPVAPERIQNFLRELENLRAEDFLDARPDGAPFGTVTLETAGGEERFELFPPEEELYPVVSSTTEYTFLIPEWRARRLLLGAEGFFAAFQEE